MQSDRDPKFQEILRKIRRLAATATDLTELQEFCVSEIAGQLSHYNWVGFYMLDATDPGVLTLGPFRGAPTEHVRIPVARNLRCGGRAGPNNRGRRCRLRSALSGLLVRNQIRNCCPY